MLWKAQMVTSWIKLIPLLLTCSRIMTSKFFILQKPLVTISQNFSLKSSLIPKFAESLISRVFIKLRQITAMPLRSKLILTHIFSVCYRTYKTKTEKLFSLGLLYKILWHWDETSDRVRYLRLILEWSLFCELKLGFKNTELSVFAKCHCEKLSSVFYFMQKLPLWCERGALH